jgi:L-alanine-DL-glutamate epimerase-like enolase superfamily enzyme
MKVTELKVHVVSVPFTEPETWRYGRLWGLTSAIVEVETDEGVTGIGESLGSPLIALVVQAIEAMRPWLVGEDPRRITHFLRRSRALGWHHYPHLGHMASAAVEMALWDIVGKVADCPVYQFFGGLERTAVPFYWYVSVPDRRPATAAAQAAEGVRRGFKTMYLKIGLDLETDLALTRAVREEVGDAVAIRVDANEGWTSFEAVRALQLFEELNLEFLEQPIDMNDLAGLADLRSRSRVRIGANQSAWLAHSVPDILARHAADVIVTDQHQLGSLSAFRDVAAICEIAGVPVVKHSFGDLGITTAAALHVLAILPEPALAHQTHLAIVEHDLLAKPFVFDDGKLDVPSAPGLGVELDRDALAHYKALYAKHGEFEGYGEASAASPIPASALRAGPPPALRT